MKYSSLISSRNLRLAWRRIVTGRNMQYKRFFRPIYMAYEVGYQENIDRLHERLKGPWQPSAPTKIYLPKPSGLQRPLALLTIENQIVLQAVANAFAAKLQDRRKKVEKRVVYSSLLTSSRNSKFFIQDWHETYSDFQSECLKYYQSGYKWVAHFDLAAFYDTISHELLIRRVSPRQGNQETWDKVRSWLGVWCASEIQGSFQHGIPQGPIASDFLAECLLLPLDETMLREGVRYVRYVDDIRIFAQSRVEAQENASKLEVYCRELGLIPQGKKFSIVKARSPEQVLGLLPSLAPPDRIEGGGLVVQMKEEDAVRKFSKSISGRPLEITDKSTARYVLYRAPPSATLLRWVLLLLPRHPEHIDAFAAYLSNYSKSVPAERVIQETLSAGAPYHYLRGELWHIMGRIGDREQCKQMIPLALQDLGESGSQMTLRWGVMSFLISCQARGLGSFTYRLRHQPPLVQALLVPVLPDTEYEKVGLIAYLLSSDDPHAGIMLAEQLVRRKLTHLDFGLKVRDLAPQVQNVFRSLGLIRRSPAVDVDQIGEILARRYGIPPINRWRTVLGSEYTHALQILLQADAVFSAGRSQWLQLQNSFNDALVRSFIAFLNARNLAGARSLVDTNNKLIKFGVLLQPGAPFDNGHPDVSAPFREANARRNRLPGSHPYDEKGGAQNRYLSLPEQSHTRARLNLAYHSLIDFVDQHA